MYNFKVGDKVKGKYWEFDKNQEQEFFDYEGIVSWSFNDGSYTVETRDTSDLLIELYDSNTMELVMECPHCSFEGTKTELETCCIKN